MPYVTIRIKIYSEGNKLLDGKMHCKSPRWGLLINEHTKRRDYSDFAHLKRYQWNYLKLKKR
ncbi:MAG: hypothetical protein GX225_03720 [Clostridiales bacterium]|nr:hypothetical protein [Clostridiales bacterium]